MISILAHAGHYARPVIAPLLLASGAFWFFVPPGDPARPGATGILSLVFAIGLVMFGAHAANPCPRCRFPADGRAAAQRGRLLLRLFHLGSRGMPQLHFYPVRIMLLLTLLLMGNGATRLLLGPPHPYDALITFVTYSVPLALVSLAIDLHARLLLWCPYCPSGETLTPDP